MSATSESVALVLSEDAGSLLHNLAARVPVWVVGSARNTLLARSIWSQKQNNLPASITTFDPGEPFNPLERAVSLIDTIEEHHPRLHQLEVFGLDLSTSAKAAFAAAGFGQFSTISGGFCASRVGR
jgi:hypothetical protein